MDELNPEGIVVGDLVRGYHSGVWKVLEIGPVETTHYGLQYQIVKYQKILDKNLSLVRKREVKECGIATCRRLTKQQLIEECAKLVKTYTEAAHLLFGGKD